MASARRAMNTIPSTFNAHQINRTVLGGTEKPAKVTMPVSCLVLSRSGSQYRTRVFENLLKCGFESIVSVEQKSESCNTDQVARLFPQVTFVVALERVTVGDMVNIGMSEIKAPYVLVVPDDLCMEELSFTPALAKKIMQNAQYCVVPRLISSDMQNVPVQFVPSSRKSVFDVSSESVLTDGSPTLYPYDGTGFFDREKFVRLGGYDYTVTSAYWQNLDLSLRAWLWGEQITVCSSFVLHYSNDIPGEDQTVDLSYLRFDLKNLLPVFENDHAAIKGSSFMAFKRRSSCGIVETIKQFNDAKQWTAQNKYRFKTDAPTLVENWGKIK